MEEIIIIKKMAPTGVRRHPLDEEVEWAECVSRGNITGIRYYSCDEDGTSNITEVVWDE